MRAYRSGMRRSKRLEMMPSTQLQIPYVTERMRCSTTSSIVRLTLSQILKEQVECLEKLEFDLIKIQFVSAVKNVDEITLLFTAWPCNNTAKVKQTKMVFHFKNGASESQFTNELFSIISHYVQMRESLL